MHTPKFPPEGMIFRNGDQSIMIVPTEKRVRSYIDGKKVVDSRSVHIIRRTGAPVTYCFRQEDVHFTFLSKSGEHTDEIGHGTSYVFNGSEDRKKVAILYEKANYAGELLDGKVIFDWKSVDLWKEENETVSIHPRDPYTRIDVVESDRKVEVRMGSTKLAETERPMMLFETGLPVRYYIPPEDVNMELLFPSDHRTGCPYKGMASYWDLKLGDQVFRNIVWSYLEPYDEVMKVKGYMCFYTEKVNPFIVDGEETR